MPPSPGLQAPPLSCPLADVLAFGTANLDELVPPGAVGQDPTYRVYASMTTTVAAMRGLKDTSPKLTNFMVGRGYGPDHTPLGFAQASWRSSCPHELSDLIRSKASAAAGKAANFTVHWRTNDFSAIVERLVAGLGHYANTGGLTPEELRGGRPLQVSALNWIDAPVGVAENQVFIPRDVDTPLSPDTFFSLACAINGEGSSVVTDVLPLDNNTNQARLIRVEGARLALGCHHALEMLAANYDAVDATAIFAYAAARGATKAVTVVGHTDEGGWFRNALRWRAFSSPSGVIDSTLRTTAAVPRLTGASMSSVAVFVDAIALSAAACVAVAEPTVVVEGVAYATVITSPGVDLVRCGLHQEAPDNASKSIMSIIASRCGDFAGNYIDALSRMFASRGQHASAVEHLISTIGARSSVVDEHLNHAAVAPYFWIEPTGILPDIFSDMPSSRCGAGPIAFPNKPQSYDWFDSFSDASQVGTHINAVVGFRSARTCGAVLHLGGHRLNGLGHMMIRQADPDAWCLPGGPNEMVMHRMIAGMDLASPLWIRGDSALPASGEAQYLRGNLALRMTAFGTDDLGDLFCTHLPTLEEFSSDQVHVRTATPCFFRVATRAAIYSRGVRRCRDLANRSLTHARDMAGALANLPNSADFPLAFKAPVQQRPTPTLAAGSSAPVTGGPSGPPRGVDEPQGPAVAHHGHAAAFRAPRAGHMHAAAALGAHGAGPPGGAGANPNPHGGPPDLGATGSDNVDQNVEDQDAGPDGGSAA